MSSSWNKIEKGNLLSKSVFNWECNWIRVLFSREHIWKWVCKFEVLFYYRYLGNVEDSSCSNLGLWKTKNTITPNTRIHKEVVRRRCERHTHNTTHAVNAFIWTAENRFCDYHSVRNIILLRFQLRGNHRRQTAYHRHIISNYHKDIDRIQWSKLGG